MKPDKCLQTNDYNKKEIVTWNHIIVYKLLILDMNTWKLTAVCLFELDRNAWCNITVCQKN